MPPLDGKSNPYANLKEGAFTKQAKAAGMSVPKFADHVIKNYKNPKTKYNPSLTTFRRARFYKNLVSETKNKKKVYQLLTLNFIKIRFHQIKNNQLYNNSLNNGEHSVISCRNEASECG